jgi:hypothetical protein
MNELGPRIRQYGCYGWNEIHAARRKIGEHKQQSEEWKQETKLQNKKQQGGNGRDRTVNVSASRERLYKIASITGKGLGFNATSEIPKGTRILMEVPLFKTPGTTKDTQSAETIVLREIKRLTRDQQRAYFALQNVQGRKCTPVLGIAIMNVLPLGDSDIRGLFYKASRIDHSCQPNAQHTWNSDLGFLTVHALFDTEADREINISYISGISLGYVERRRHLVNTFSFTGACELCSLPLFARATSDYKLDQIRSIIEDEDAAINVVQVLQHPVKTFSQVHRLRKLQEVEGICDIRIAQAYFTAFQIAAVLGDKARANVFAERAYAARRMFSGDDNPTTIEFKHLARQPVNHPMYGMTASCYNDNWEAPQG